MLEELSTLHDFLAPAIQFCACTCSLGVGAKRAPPPHPSPTTAPQPPSQPQLMALCGLHNASFFGGAQTGQVPTCSGLGLPSIPPSTNAPGSLSQNAQCLCQPKHYGGFVFASQSGAFSLKELYWVLDSDSDVFEFSVNFIQIYFFKRFFGVGRGLDGQISPLRPFWVLDFSEWMVTHLS